MNFASQHGKERWGPVLRSLQIGLLGLILLLWAAGCASNRPCPNRSFSFESDTFNYANELKWVYRFDEEGKWSAKRRDPAPDYTLHCFVVARSAKQFFQNARFVEALPKEDEPTTRKLIRKVIQTNPRKVLPPAEKTVIPGYRNLREFSLANERILKEECGGAWQSYVQRGHWRMLLPFSRSGQAAQAEQLMENIQANGSAVVHIVQFPSLAVNHAILLFDVTEDVASISFSAYDPNKPEAPTRLTFDRASRTFAFPGNDYFVGGKVNAYEVYNRFWN